MITSTWFGTQYLARSKAVFAQGAGGPIKNITKSLSVMVKGGIFKLDPNATGGKAVVAVSDITP